MEQANRQLLQAQDKFYFLENENFQDAQKCSGIFFFLFFQNRDDPPLKNLKNVMPRVWNIINYVPVQ